MGKRVKSTKPVAVDETRNPIIADDEVDRPVSTRGRWQLDETIHNVIRTAETGKARRIRMTVGEFVHRVHMHLRHAVKKEDLKFHYKQIDEHELVVWATKAEQANSKMKP